MIPIKNVVLYKHGVASIERRGLVHDNQSLSLNFKPDEMNDVLKSLTVVDQSGKGQIASISYDNDQPVSVRLENTNIELNDQRDNIISFLNQIKGARITASDSKVSWNGLVMGITSTQIAAGEHSRQARQLDLLIEGNRIESLILTPETVIRLEDESLQRNLSTHLSILSSGKRQDRKSVTIFAKGEGERALSVCYTIKAPMWKVSYRIVLNPNKTTSKSVQSDETSPSSKKPKTEETKEKEQVLIQAWAIVDNISDEKWTDVSLTLMAGQPHSVDCDLFTPSYDRGGLQPPVMMHGAARVQRQLRQALPQQLPQMQQMQQMMQMQPMQLQQQQQQMQQNMLSNFVPTSPQMSPAMPSAAKVETEEVGDLFKYELAKPVTVNPNQSALVPIAITSSNGSRVAVFQDDKHHNHPNSAVMLVNTTGLTFEKGPVTVLDGSLYVGEALLETLKPGETRFVEFSTELSVEVWSTEDKAEQVIKTTIHGGVMTMHQRVVYRKTYKLRSKSSRDVMVYLHHKFRKDCKLLTTETKEQTNPNPINYYIFDVLAQASTTTVFKVSEHCTSTSTQRLALSDGYFDTWFRSNYVDQKTSAVLSAAATLAGKMRECDRAIQTAEAKITSISANQSRLRDNLRCLSSSDHEVALRKKYIADMSADEAVLESARDTIVRMKAAKDNLTEQREKLFEGIELTHSVE